MRRVAVLVVLTCASWTGVLRAQSTNASVAGRVTDPSKAVIVGAKVAAISAGTNVRYEAATNGSGEYYLTNLPPGSYRLEIEKPGFKKVIKPDVILHDRVGGSWHGDRPHVCRQCSPQWQEFPDIDHAHARRGRDRYGQR
jgi:hypothetical protein